MKDDFAHHRYKPSFRLLVLHDDFATVFAAADREDAAAARPAVKAV